MTATWYQAQSLADLTYHRGSMGGSDLTTNTSDPNSATPAETDVFLIPASENKQAIMSMVAMGGTATAVAWVYSPTLARWYKIATLSLTADVASGAGAAVSSVSIPDNVPCYIQLTAVGTGCKALGVMVH